MAGRGAPKRALPGVIEGLAIGDRYFHVYFHVDAQLTRTRGGRNDDDDDDKKAGQYPLAI